MAQRECIAEWCEEHDHPVDKYIAFSDPFNLLDALDEGDTLVMTSYKRVSRNPEKFLTFAHQCQERDIQLIVIEEQMTVPGHSAELSTVVEEALENFG